MDILETLFTGLNGSNIDYFVVGDYFDLPVYSGRTDLDIYVNRLTLNRFFTVFNNIIRSFNGQLVSFFKSTNCLHLRLIGYKNEWWSLQIDIIFTRFEFLTKEYFPLEVLKDNVILYNKIKVVDYKIGYCLGFIKELLHTKKVKEKYLQTFKNAIVSSDPVLKNAIISFYGNKIWNEFDCAFKKEKFCTDLVTDLLVKKLFRDKIQKHFYYLRKIRFLKRIFQKPGFTICFLGADGSGKSTIIDQITLVLNKAFHNTVYYEHMRPNYLPSLAVLFGKKNMQVGPVTNPHGGEPSGFVSSLFRLAYYLIDYTIGYFIKIFPKKAFKSSVWIFDRYYYDYYIDQRRTGLKLPKWIIRCGLAIIPEPDIIICFGTDPGIIHSRKPELPQNEIERQVKALKIFAKRHIRAFWIDTGTTIKESTDTTLNQIVKIMAKRFEDIKLS